MILHCSYEEARALQRGIAAVLSPDGDRGTVIAPPRETRAVQAYARRVEGDQSIQTLSELEGVEVALMAIVDALRFEMDSLVLATHPASEEAVNAYFDFAHGLTALNRARELKDEMRALIELMTGAPVDETSASEIVFPD